MKGLVKEWFIRIENREEGPFSIEDLKRDLRLTPDTLVWKEGFSQWVPIRSVAELKEIFKDPEKKSDNGKNKNKASKDTRPDNEVMAISYEPFQFWLWLVIFLLLLIYLLYKLNRV